MNNMAAKFSVTSLLSLPIVNKISTMSPTFLDLTRRFHSFINFPFHNDLRGGGESLSFADWQQSFQSLPSTAPTEKIDTYRHNRNAISRQEMSSRRNIHYNAHPVYNSKTKRENQVDDITYCMVPWARCEKVSKFLLKHYVKHEPMSKALGMPLKEVDGWFKMFIKQSMYVSVSDICVEAIDYQNKRRVGVLCSVLYDPRLSKRPIEDDYTNPVQHPTYTKMNEFYEALEKGLDPAEAAGVEKDGAAPPKILEHMFASVDPEYWKRGISSKMIALSESIAANTLNCRIGYTVATSEYSYAIFLKHGYKVVRECKYSTYTDSKGKKIFEGKEDKLKPHHTCRAMVKAFKSLY